MTEKSTKAKEKKKEGYDLSNFWNLVKLFKEKSNQEIKESIWVHLDKIISEFSFSKDTKVIFIYDDIDNFAADKIYKAISEKEQENILLILDSPGGKIEPAYLISKCCKELSKKQFKVSIPRRAKSAATLISLGADEIHMWKMSHLWPIDPQINGLPALWLSDAVDYLARLTSRFPEASDMISWYLSNKLDLQSLGFFERVSESAVQYAKRLLNKKKLSSWLEVEDVAIKLVYSYKDHSFVIDDKEARKYLDPMIKSDSEEYKLSNKIHTFLEEVKLVSKVIGKKNFSLTWDSKNWIMIFDDES